MIAYLIYFIAFVSLAAGSAVHPFYSNSSAAANVATNASTAAQSSVNSNSTYLNIQKFAGRGCKQHFHAQILLLPNRSLGTGYSYTYRNITSHYGLAIINSHVAFSSFKLSRPLRGREQLDFSTIVGGAPLTNSTNWCEVFLHSYWPWTSPGKESDEHTDFHVNIKQRDVLILLLILVHFVVFGPGSTN